MSSVSFAGKTLVDSSEGGFRYTPGVKTADAKFGKPARGNRMWVKDLGYSGAEHQVNLTYDIPTSDLDNVLERFAEVGNGRIGNLSLTGFPTVMRCVMGKPRVSQIKRSKTGYYFAVDVTFQEL